MPDEFLLLRADNAALVSDFWNSGDRDQKCNLPVFLTLLKIFRTVFLTVSIKNNNLKKGISILEPIFWGSLLCSANLKILCSAVEKVQKI